MANPLHRLAQLTAGALLFAACASVTLGRLGLAPPSVPHHINRVTAHHSFTTDQQMLRRYGITSYSAPYEAYEMKCLADDGAHAATIHYALIWHEGAASSLPYTAIAISRNFSFGSLTHVQAVMVRDQEGRRHNARIPPETRRALMDARHGGWQDRSAALDMLCETLYTAFRNPGRD